jgi:hypothetical protein
VPPGESAGQRLSLEEQERASLERIMSEMRGATVKIRDIGMAVVVKVRRHGRRTSEGQSRRKLVERAIAVP